jgi:O-antigen ligase
MSPYRRVLLPAAALVAVLLYTVAPLIDDRYAAERVSTDRASGRIDIWFTAWHVFTEQPFMGVGAGNFVPQSIDLLVRTPGVELVKSHLLTGKGIEVHNIYLESLAERGIFGLLTLATLLICTLAGLFIAARRFPSPAIQALAPMLVAFCVAAFFLSVTNSKLLWMLIGLSAALLTLSTPHPSPAAGPPPSPRSVR